MNKYPLMCRIFGHKFIATIYDSSLFSETTYITSLKAPMCKRCGLILRYAHSKLKEGEKE